MILMLVPSYSRINPQVTSWRALQNRKNRLCKTGFWPDPIVKGSVSPVLLWSVPFQCHSRLATLDKSLASQKIAIVRKIAAFSNRKVLNRRVCRRNRRKIARKSQKKSQKNR